MGWIGSLFGPGESRDARALERELASLRQELAENTWLMSQWRDEVQKARSGFSSHVDDAVTDRVRWLLLDLSAPLAAILGLGAADADSAGDPAAVRRVAQAVASALRRHKVQVLCEPGQRVPFDPELHEPVGGAGAETFAAGAPVVVRTPALRHGDALLAKAWVESADG